MIFSHLSLCGHPTTGTTIYGTLVIQIAIFVGVAAYVHKIVKRSSSDGHFFVT